MLGFVLFLPLFAFFVSNSLPDVGLLREFACVLVIGEIKS
jgi:hypothetical protein